MSNERVLLLEGGVVLTLDTPRVGRAPIGTRPGPEADGRGVDGLAVAVAGERVAAVGPARALHDRFPAAQRVDCSGRLIMPGLVNAHLHPEMHVLKGIVEDIGLHEWAGAELLNRALAFLGSAEGRPVQCAAVRAAFADALLSGTTRVGSYGVTAGADEIAAAAMGELGLPGHITIRDAAFHPAVGPDGAARIPASRLAPPRMYRLHAEEALTPDELRAAAAAHTRGERLVMHAAETQERILHATTAFGSSTIRLLDQYHLLSERMLLSHAIHLDEEERELLAARGAIVISSPVAEMKLSDGVAPIADYLALGITVALGTDAAACNNSGDMFLECKQLGLVQKLASGTHALPAERVLQCATAGGARAFGESAERGAIASGHFADLILLDTRNTRLQPLVDSAGFSNVAANIVYAATGQDVTDVMIAGRWVVRHRRLLTADQEAIADELGRAAAELYTRLAVPEPVPHPSLSR